MAASLLTTQIFEDGVEEISAEDLESLRGAVDALEHASLVARVSAIAGQQLDLIGRFVPRRFANIAQSATTVALRAALHAALRNLKSLPAVADRRQDVLRVEARKSRLRRLAAASGAAGGALGFVALAVELPISTTLLLRGIGEIARHEGEDLSQPEAALACLEVFALGGKSASGAALESSYFAVRSLLATTVAEATRFLVQNRTIDEAAPVLVRLIAQIAGRFGLVVSQKFAAQAVPVVGAIGGAGLNYAFADHFQRLAHGHFIVRRLERKYGKLLVRETYERLNALAARRS